MTADIWSNGNDWTVLAGTVRLISKDKKILCGLFNSFSDRSTIINSISDEKLLFFLVYWEQNTKIIDAIKAFTLIWFGIIIKYNNLH